MVADPMRPWYRLCELEPKVTISSVQFKNYKAFADFSLTLRHTNILVGPNNCGKSTVLGAFRVLATGLRRAASKGAAPVPGPDGQQQGYPISGNEHPVSLENVHTNYSSEKSAVTFRLSNGSTLMLFFPRDGGASLVMPGREIPSTSPKQFRTLYPLNIGVVPVLGPVEHDEILLHRDTVSQALGTHRASRHFRNYWYHFPERFEEFRNAIQETWPGMDIKSPEMSQGTKDVTLHMFCKERRIDRELYWVGFGFQVWCQLLTHTLRSADTNILVVDEPEIYLHPDLQRQLVGIFRSAGPDLLLATHSSELIGEADANEIILIDKTSRKGKRLKAAEAIQDALDYLGSSHNITLTQIARTRHILFVEGEDFKLLRQWAERLGLKELAGGIGIVPISVGGFGQWKHVESLASGLQTTLGQPMLLAAVFDRDYYSPEELRLIDAKLRRELRFVQILRRKEIENYLLIPAVLERCVEIMLREKRRRTGKQVASAQPMLNLLDQISAEMKSEVSGELVGKALEFSNRLRYNECAATISTRVIADVDAKWADVMSRLEIVPGKKLLSRINQELQTVEGISLTPTAIIRETHADEIPEDMVSLLRGLESFRKQDPPMARQHSVLIDDD